MNLPPVTAENTQPSKARRSAAGLRNVVLFCVALFGVSAIQPRDTIPDSGLLSRKWAHFQEAGNRYSFVFVGSSRVAHHFIPEQFDATLQEAGLEMKSFNFGQDGMFPPESFYVLRKLFEETPMRPRWVAIDLMNFRPILKGNEEAERTVAWHDLRHTFMVCRMLLSPDYTKPAGEPWLLYHVRLLARRTLGIGRWQDAIRQRLKLRTPSSSQVIMAGYNPLETREMKNTERESFINNVNELATTKRSDIPTVYRRELEALIALVREHGAEPIFVVSPDIYPAQRYNDWPPAGVTQFSYDRPDTYPTLYLPEQRYDASHLDGNGAKEFTRIFAAEFADWLKRK